VDSGTNHQVLNIPITEIRGAAWKPEGTQVAIAGRDGVVVINYELD